MPRFVVRSVTGCHQCSYDRSQYATIARTSVVDMIATTSRTISYDGSYHRNSPIVRDSATTRRPLLEFVANIADRSHLGPIATNRTTHKSYDPV